MSLLLVGILAGCSGGGQGECDAPGVTIEVIGAPDWTITTPVVFAAPFAEGGSTGETEMVLFPEPLWGTDTDGTLIAGEMSSLAFEDYLHDQVNGSSFITGDTFGREHFSGGSAIFIVFLLVPGTGAPGGTSSDSPTVDAPMIPHSTYPIGSTGDVFRNCEVFNPNLEFVLVRPPETAEAFDGQSRVPVVMIDAYELRSPEVTATATGTYLHDQTLLDSLNRGYRFTVQYEIE